MNESRIPSLTQKSLPPKVTTRRDPKVTTRRDPKVTTRRDPKVTTHLLSKGKPKKVALVAVMRKLLVTLNVMARDRQIWREPNSAKAAA